VCCSQAVVESTVFSRGPQNDHAFQGPFTLNDLLWDGQVPDIGMLSTAIHHTPEMADIRTQLGTFERQAVSNQIRAFFRERRIIRAQDVTILVLRTLWQTVIAPGQEPPTILLERIVATQTRALLCANIPRWFPHVVQSGLASMLFGLSEVRTVRHEAREVLRCQCPHYSTLRASMLIDTLYFAGGLALPQLLSDGLAVLYASNAHVSRPERHHALHNPPRVCI
jgi:hypothetical protein